MERISPKERDKEIRRVIRRGQSAIRSYDLNKVLEAQNELQKLGAYNFAEALVEEFQEEHKRVEALALQTESDYRDMTGANNYGFSRI